MDYSYLITKINETIMNDYSGYSDKKQSIENISFFTESQPIKNEKDFLNVTRKFLYQFKDRHLQIYNPNAPSVYFGIKLRRFEDYLYVMESEDGSGFLVRDIITHLDGIPIPDLAKKYRNTFFSDIKDRQDWTTIIKDFKTAKVVRNNVDLCVDFTSIEMCLKDSSQNYTFDYIFGVPRITLLDFNNEQAIKDLLDKHELELDRASAIIIDVRNNAGGSDLAYFPLLDYMFEQDTSYDSLFDGETMELLYSKNNCDLRIQMFNNVLENQTLPDYAVEYIKSEISSLKTNYGKGFLSVPQGDDYIITGKGKNKQIFVLTDIYCGSSGDSFARIAQKSPITTLVGRNTAGVLDYSNCAFLNLDNTFELMYPTSRHLKDGKILGIDNIGVSPDIFVEWTPKHIVEDVDINTVLNIIQKSGSSNINEEKTTLDNN